MNNSYYSPFPRHKSNKEVLQKSHTINHNNANLALIDIPRTVTVSYMKRNPYYFDLKKSIKPTSKAKSQSKTIKAKPRTERYTLFDNKRLDNILNSTRDKYIFSRPKLNPGCEQICSKKKGKAMTAKQIRELTPSEALKILNQINYPEPKTYVETPNYLNEFKIRNFIEKEYERLVEEEKHYPKGTFKLWEKDRIFILNNLYTIKEELMQKLCAFPVNYYLRSIKITKSRAQVEKKLNEIDFAIKIFELTNVFLESEEH